MKMVYKNIKAHYMVFLSLATIVLITYHGVFSTFYQQDEWLALGHIFAKGFALLYDVEAGQNVFRLFFAEGRTLSTFMYLFIYGIKYFSIVPISAFGLLVHTLNAFLVYILAKKISRNFWIGFLASVFFAVNSVGSEAITWAAAIGTLPATALLLCSLLLYLDFLETKSIRQRNYSFVVGILSLFFKETGLFIFVLYPCLYILWGKAKRLKDALIANGPLVLYGAAMVIFRILEIFFAPKAPARFLGGPTGGFVFPILYHIVSYPLISFFQMFVPAVDMYSFVPYVTRSEYAFLINSPLVDLVAQSTVADTVSLMGTIGLIGILVLMIFSDRKKGWAQKFVFVGLLVVASSFLPYAVLQKPFSYFSSRYYYVGIVGAAIIFGYMISWLFQRLPKIGKLVLLFGVIIYLSHHVWAIREDINRQVSVATERKKFIAAIQRIHPNLTNKTVFYITSDKKYWGEITYPFQNGLGYILEVLYYNTGMIPKDFLASDFLWDLGSEGYHVSGEYGFGYFQQLDSVGKLVKEGSITPNFVYGYQYDSAARKMIDITDTVRAQLATFSGGLK